MNKIDFGYLPLFKTTEPIIYLKNGGDKMEFIKVGKDKYMIKDSNGYIISEKQKDQYEKNLLNPEHKPCNCDKKKKSTSKKIEVQNDTIKKTTKSI